MQAGFYTMYTNFPGKQSLCTNYREPGLHYHGRVRVGREWMLILIATRLARKRKILREQLKKKHSHYH